MHRRFKFGIRNFDFLFFLALSFNLLATVFDPNPLPGGEDRAHPVLVQIDSVLAVQSLLDSVESKLIRWKFPWEMLGLEHIQKIWVILNILREKLRLRFDRRLLILFFLDSLLLLPLLHQLLLDSRLVLSVEVFEFQIIVGRY